jgi:hypothetical protein
MKTLIKLPFTLLIRYYYKLFPKRYRIDKWKREGKPAPPPREIKVKTILKYAKKYNVNIFVETGTFLGDTTNDVSQFFKKLYSIELDKDLFARARSRFENFKNICLINGDSGEQLGLLLEENNKIKEKTLFWLDGHYSEGITARGELITPIIKELIAIYNHKIKNNIDHVVLIDDAHLFNGTDDYPTIEFMKKQKENFFPDYNFHIENNIIIFSSN